MLSYGTKFILGLIGTALVMTFVLGLSHSISTGFAGFKGGLPFMLIAFFVLGLAIYNFWEDCIRRK
ncbi:MAG: hypothetical protein OEY05_04690 [Paracoccaceae bacterium]|nr:hypothetical protein [Paracoccaceae bacterium]